MSKKITPIKKAKVHPLVLLNVIDHYTRVTKGANFRVVGMLLGSVKGDVVDVVNSYAVPFEEDRRDEDVWFFDKNYSEEMYQMCQKVTSKEKIVGWYSTGPSIKKCDIHIHNMISKYTPNPVYVIIEGKPKENTIPTKAYVCVEERKDPNKQPIRTFDHIQTEIDSIEPEEIGVEALLRRVKGSVETDLKRDVEQRKQGLDELCSSLNEIMKYLDDVVNGKYQINNQIVYILQDIFNMLPQLKLETIKDAFVNKTNDKMVVLYLSNVMRTILSLHDLINNKLDSRDLENKEKVLEKFFKKEKKRKALEQLKKDEEKKKEESKKLQDKMDIS